MLKMGLPLLLLVSTLLGQEFMPTIDIQLGKIGAPELLLVQIPIIRSGVVFQRQPHTSSCPTTIPGEFELKKVNPQKGHFASMERVDNFCFSIDSVSIDTSNVYEINTSEGLVYYLRLLELNQGKVKVRITSANPLVAALKKNVGRKMGTPEKGFLANGKRGPSLFRSGARGFS